MTILIGTRKIRIPQPKLLTYDDYVRLTPPESGNYELHKGQIIYMATPVPKHQEISFLLTLLLGNHIVRNKLGKLYAAPMDVVFTKNDTVQPDLLFISNEKLEIIGEKKIEGAPDLVIEIFSPSNTTKEMSYKKHIYESCGVKEYWVILPEKKLVRQYENRENELFVVGEFQENETLEALSLPDFKLNVKDVFTT